jgi:hypothetical protein
MSGTSAAACGTPRSVVLGCVRSGFTTRGTRMPRCSSVPARTSSASHADSAITLSTYSHAFARRDTVPLGEALAAFMRKESGGLDLGSGGENRERHLA